MRMESKRCVDSLTQITNTQSNLISITERSVILIETLTSLEYGYVYSRGSVGLYLCQ